MTPSPAIVTALGPARPPPTTQPLEIDGAFQDASSTASSSSLVQEQHHHQQHGHGDRQSAIRDYCLGFLPPHVRRRGLTLPPLGEIGRKFVSALSFPYFPMAGMNWKVYGTELVTSDIMGGLTAGIMMVPQSMAYAVIANLPPIFGLYASTVTGFVYAPFGTSGALSIGAVILVSLFMSETYTNLGIPLTSKDKDPILNHQDHYHTYVREEVAAIVSFAVAILLCGMALFRVGSLMKFISPSVLSGFVTGSAVYIFITQSKYIWGFKVPHEEVQLKEFSFLFRHLKSDSNRYSMAIGIPSFFALWGLRTLRIALTPALRRLRANGRSGLANTFTLLLSSTTLLVICIVTVVASQWVQEGKDIKVIGRVPAGFNPFSIPKLSNTFYGTGIPFGKVLMSGVPIALLTYLESISVARKYSVLYKYPLDMTQELWALGMSCLVGSFFKAYPPGGGFSRTALQSEMGGRTPLANVVASLFVSLVLVVATGLLKFVPMAVLAALICTNIMSLFDFHEMWRALWVAPVDFVIMIFTFFVTVLYNVEKGLTYGIIASVLILLLQFSKMDLDSLGQMALTQEQHSTNNHLLPRVPPTPSSKGEVLCALDNYPAARQHPTVKVFRLRANLFFGNVSTFRDEFYASIAETREPIKAVIIDASGVLQLDLSALAVIDELLTEMKKQGIDVYMAAATSRVVKKVEAYELLEELGGLPLVRMEVGDVFWSVLEEVEGRSESDWKNGQAHGREAVQALAEHHKRMAALEGATTGGGEGEELTVEVVRRKANM